MDARLCMVLLVMFLIFGVVVSQSQGDDNGYAEALLTERLDPQRELFNYDGPRKMGREAGDGGRRGSVQQPRRPGPPSPKANGPGREKEHFHPPAPNAPLPPLPPPPSPPPPIY